VPTINPIIVSVSNVKYCKNNSIKSKAPHSITELSLLIYSVQTCSNEIQSTSCSLG